MKKNDNAFPGDKTPGFVYILKCADDTLYTGWTNDIVKRFHTHSSGKGAKYTRGRLPVELVYLEAAAEKSEGLRREACIKKLSRKQKLELAESVGNIAGEYKERLK